MCCCACPTVPAPRPCGEGGCCICTNPVRGGPASSVCSTSLSITQEFVETIRAGDHLSSRVSIAPSRANLLFARYKDAAYIIGTPVFTFARGSAPSLPVSRSRCSASNLASTSASRQAATVRMLSLLKAFADKAQPADKHNAIQRNGGRRRFRVTAVSVAAGWVRSTKRKRHSPTAAPTGRRIKRSPK